jgi:hypothetical protein
VVIVAQVDRYTVNGEQVVPPPGGFYGRLDNQLGRRPLSKEDGVVEPLAPFAFERFSCLGRVQPLGTRRPLPLHREPPAVDLSQRLLAELVPFSYRELKATG